MAIKAASNTFMPKNINETFVPRNINETFVPRNIEKRAKDLTIIQANELVKYNTFVKELQQNLKALKNIQRDDAKE